VRECVSVCGSCIVRLHASARTRVCSHALFVDSSGVAAAKCCWWRSRGIGLPSDLWWVPIPWPGHRQAYAQFRGNYCHCSRPRETTVPRKVALSATISTLCHVVIPMPCLHCFFSHDPHLLAPPWHSCRGDGQTQCTDGRSRVRGL